MVPNSFWAVALVALAVSCGKPQQKNGYVFTYFDNSRQDAGLFLAYSLDGGFTWEDATDRIGVPEGISHGTAIAVPASCIDALRNCQPDSADAAL